jgi:hypothetical protein
LVVTCNKVCPFCTLEWSLLLDTGLSTSNMPLGSGVHVVCLVPTYNCYYLYCLLLSWIQRCIANGFGYWFVAPPLTTTMVPSDALTKVVAHYVIAKCQCTMDYQRTDAQHRQCANSRSCATHATTCRMRVNLHYRAPC